MAASIRNAMSPWTTSTSGPTPQHVQPVDVFVHHHRDGDRHFLADKVAWHLHGAQPLLVAEAAVEGESRCFWSHHSGQPGRVAMTVSAPS